MGLPPPPPPHTHTQPAHEERVRGVKHLLSDPMAIGSNTALGTPAWTEIQFHESTHAMRGKLGCQVADEHKIEQQPRMTWG